MFLCGVIEHVENPTKLMGETFRVLKNHGKSMLTTPNPWHWRRILRAMRNKRIVLSDTTHISAYTPVGIENLLINRGFKSIILDFVTPKHVKIHGRHASIDAIGERLLPKAISMSSLLVMAEKNV